MQPRHPTHVRRDKTSHCKIGTASYGSAMSVRCMLCMFSPSLSFGQKSRRSLIIVYLIQVPVLPFLSHWTLLLLSVVPVPQDTEQLDQLLQGSDTGRGGAVEKLN